MLIAAYFLFYRCITNYCNFREVLLGTVAVTRLLCFVGRLTRQTCGIISGVVHILFDFCTTLITLHGGCSWTRTHAIEIIIQNIENFSLQKHFLLQQIKYYTAEESQAICCKCASILV